MNSTTHAYSVVAFLLVLGSTLLALPSGVLSQSDPERTQDTISGESVSQEEILVEPTEDQAVEREQESEVQVTSSEMQDSYKREDLPTQEVFSDFVVGPGRAVLELAPGESKTIELIISNRMGVPKRFSIKTEDVAGTNDASSALVLLGEDRGPYSLRDYISVPDFEFNLDHAKRVRVPVTVTLPADAPPGGRYGSLLVSIVSDSNDESGADGASAASVVISRIGVLLFVSNPGDTVPSLELKDFSTIGGKSLYGKGPISLGITHENTGQVHLAPYGELSIVNMLGDEVGFIQLDPWFVLPQALRTREVAWDRELLIGRYTVTALVNRGYDDVIDEATYVFWVLPWKIFASVFAGIFLMFLALRFIVTRFEFKRK